MGSNRRGHNIWVEIKLYGSKQAANYLGALAPTLIMATIEQVHISTYPAKVLPPNGFTLSPSRVKISKDSPFARSNGFVLPHSLFVAPRVTSLLLQGVR